MRTRFVDILLTFNERFMFVNYGAFFFKDGREGIHLLCRLQCWGKTLSGLQGQDI